MSDDDHSPASSDDGQPGGVGFSAFGDDERAAEHRARRKNLAVKVVAGALVLVAVGAVAALTSNGPAKSGKAPAASTGGTPGKVVQPVPPEVIFETAKLGYALYVNCASQPVGQFCQPALFRTTDGANTWDPVKLPAGTPVDPTAFLSMQVNDHSVLLAWSSNFVALLPNDDDGSHWTRVQGSLDGVVAQLAPGDFLVGNSTPMMVVHPDPQKAGAATAFTFRPPQRVVLPGVTGGTLSDGQLWMRDPSALGLSSDAGVHWNVALLPNAETESDPLSGGPGFLALLTGPAKDVTTGTFGDGGVLPARNAFFSTDGGTSWLSPTALTGATVNAVCTVYLDGNHSLLGVATDGKALLSLPPSKSSFVAVTGAQKPPVTPSCLQSHDSLVWGVSQATPQKLVLSVDGAKSWTVLDGPKGPYAVAKPSPTPSSAK